MFVAYFNIFGQHTHTDFFLVCHITSFNDNNNSESGDGDDENATGNNEELLPNNFAMKRHLHRIRNGVMPVSPRTPLEIIENYDKAAIMQEYGMTTGRNSKCSGQR